MLDLTPLTEASKPIQIHALAALSAFILGLVQFALPKGTVSHRCLGYVWSSLMLVIATSSFLIHEIRQFGAFSVIHLLSVQVLVMVPYYVLQARRGRIETHRSGMAVMFVGALVVAGLFTLLPTRIMHDVVFGR